jgi:hypothetical protein
MALANMTAHLVDAMESSIAARGTNNNPLKNKVVHADIRVHGIDDDFNVTSPEEAGAQLVEQPHPSTQDVEDQERAEEMQTWWNTEMRKHMNQPDGYAKVAVLLIKWADELDDLKTKDEVCAAMTAETPDADCPRPLSSKHSSATASTIRPRRSSSTSARSRSTS